MKPELVEEIREALKSYYSNTGRVAFWPSVLRDFGSAEDIGSVLSSLFEEGFLGVNVSIYCPQGHEIVRNDFLGTVEDLKELSSLYAHHECCECDDPIELQFYDEGEYEVDFSYVLPKWLTRRLDKKKQQLQV